MDDARRQQLNVRTIRLTLDSGLKGASPELGRRLRASAARLLDEAHHEATAPDVRREIEDLQAELDRALEESGEASS